MSDMGFQGKNLAGCRRGKRRIAVLTGIVLGCLITLTLSMPRAWGGMGMGGWPPSEPDPEPPTQRPLLDRVGGLKSPSRMAMSNSGQIYVSDTKRGIVAIFNGEGERIGTLSGLTSPLGLALLDVEITIVKPVETCLPTVDRHRIDILEEKLRKIDRKIGKIEEKLQKRKDSMLRFDEEIGFDENDMKKGRPKRKIEKKQRSIEQGQLKLKRAKRKRRRIELKLKGLIECTTGITYETVVVPRAYVGDEGDGSVRIFEDGLLMAHLGKGPGEFSKPNGISATSAGMVYVADSVARHIAQYDETGNRLGTFSLPYAAGEKMPFPTDIALNESTGELYVSDFANGRIVVFGLDGAWLRNIPAPLNSAGDPAFFRAAGLGIDPSGNLYVADNALSCLVIMKSTGELIDIIGYQNGQYWTKDLSVPVDSVSDGYAVWVSSSRSGFVNVYEVIQ